MLDLAVGQPREQGVVALGRERIEKAQRHHGAVELVVGPAVARLDDVRATEDHLVVRDAAGEERCEVGAHALPLRGLSPRGPGPRLTKPAPQGGAGHLQDASHVLELPPLVEQGQRRPKVDLLPRAPAVLPAGLRASDAGHHALAEQGPFVVGERPEQLEEEPPGRRGGVDPGVADRGEVDPVGRELVEDLEQVRERAPETVQLPHHEEVEESGLGVGQHPVERRPRGPRAGQALIDVVGGDSPAAPCCDLA